MFLLCFLLRDIDWVNINGPTFFEFKENVKEFFRESWVFVDLKNNLFSMFSSDIGH